MKLTIAPIRMEVVYSLSFPLGINNCILIIEATEVNIKDMLKTFSNTADSVNPSPKYNRTNMSAVARNPNITGKTLKKTNDIDFLKNYGKISKVKNGG